MTTTKKGFLKAGAILAIISAVLSALLSFVLISSATMLSEDLIIKSYENELGYVLHEEADGSYYIEYFEDREDQITNEPEIVTDEEIQSVVKYGKVLLVVGTVFILGIAAAEFIFAILILNKLSKDQSSKGQIITLLVLSLVSGLMLTSAFMIVALCLKDKPKATLENINEIASSNQN